MRGYAGKFLEVDLSDESIKEITFPDETLRDYIGGRGLAAKILWDRFGDSWEDLDPLGPENLLTVFTGPMTGYFLERGSASLANPRRATGSWAPA